MLWMVVVVVVAGERDRHLGFEGGIEEMDLLFVVAVALGERVETRGSRFESVESGRLGRSCCQQLRVRSLTLEDLPLR